LKFYSASARPAHCRDNDLRDTGSAALHRKEIDMIAPARSVDRNWVAKKENANIEDGEEA
jgi:hypothetical protein